MTRYKLNKDELGHDLPGSDAAAISVLSVAYSPSFRRRVSNSLLQILIRIIIFFNLFIITWSPSAAPYTFTGTSNPLHDLQPP